MKTDEKQQSCITRDGPCSSLQPVLNCRTIVETLRQISVASANVRSVDASSVGCSERVNSLDYVSGFIHIFSLCRKLTIYRHVCTSYMF